MKKDLLSCLKERSATALTRKRTFVHRRKPPADGLWSPFVHKESRRNPCGGEGSCVTVGGQRDPLMRERGQGDRVSPSLGPISCMLLSPALSDLFTLYLNRSPLWGTRNPPPWWPDTSQAGCSRLVLQQFFVTDSSASWYESAACSEVHLPVYFIRLPRFFWNSFSDGIKFHLEFSCSLGHFIVCFTNI